MAVKGSLMRLGGRLYIKIHANEINVSLHGNASGCFYALRLLYSMTLAFALLFMVWHTQWACHTWTST